MAKLTDKQELFCREYIIDLNAKQAAIRAGYSEKTAAEQGARLLTNVNVQNYIYELKQKRNDRTEVNADYVLNRLVDIDQMDVADILNDDMSLKPLSEWPKCWRQTLQGVDIIYMASKDDTETLIKKIKWPDKVKNLELLGRHVNVQAFKDKVEQESTNINVDMDKEEFKQARKEMLDEDDC